MNPNRARRVARGWLAAGEVLLCAASAQAMTLLPADGDAEAFKCLTRVEGAPATIEYPERERFESRGGTVRVRMEFFDRNKGPLVEVLSSPPALALSDAVRSYVDDYRLPCLKKDKSGRRTFAIQEFAFYPRDARQVTWFNPVAVAEQTQDDCKLVGIEHTHLTLFPHNALRENAQGRVLALATFEGPGRAPQITILRGGGHRDFDQAAKNALGQVKIDCGANSGEWPRHAMQLYAFQIDGEARSAFKDVDLKTLVAAIDQLGSHKVRFDLSSMGCPFEVELQLYQPYAANSVAEVGKTDPNRQGFLAWLSKVALRLPPKAIGELLGRDMRIAVPCGVLDLTS